ncbi:ABC-2 type transport system ATP-binding protein [Blastococcus aurantiacus]|uniref:ABC-2 type transport system ATP-binding protein n=1 Tax=Blastococcus aurantiacus TaxID=1550231 RepID=A0A1G7PP76_9ACTN|nr:CocE/NonD family hydrolase [Blastococcus aurantiacus]SDF88073.1 ABC-2 type transport system ATP-binding protein [Blastococcus aurantiacus]
MRRAATVLLSSVLAAGGMAAVAPPAAATAEIAPRDLTITVTGLGPEKRTCRIDADLYVPAGVSRNRPAPALLTTNGFGGTKDDQADFAQGFGEHGYVTLAYTGLGFVDGDTCPITLDDVEHDGAAASQLLRFLGGDPSIAAIDDTTGERVRIDQVVREDARTKVRHDPQVGMIGGSYGGQIQFAAAGFENAARTNRLDAIVPQITWNDLSYSLAPENSSLPGGTVRNGSARASGTGVFKYQWAALFTALGAANGVQDLRALADPAQFTAFFTAASQTRNCANFEPQVCTALAEVATLGYPSRRSVEYLRSNSVTSYMRNVRVPTLLGQGQADTLFNLQESVATYSALKRQGTPVSLMWQSWGHSSSAPQPGELDERHPARSLQGAAALAWFDHYVRDRGPRPPQGFAYYRDWVHRATGSIAKAYAVAPSYPVGTERTFHLSSTGAGGGALVASPRQVAAGTSGYTSTAPIGPNYTETSFLDQTGPVTDPGPTAIRFSTPPLAQPLDVVGSPRLTVQLTAPAVALSQRAGPGGQLVAYAKVYDVGPDGAVELPRRLISPVRITDVTRPVTIELPGIVHRFEKGHSLAVVLAGGDLAYRGATFPQQVQLTTGPGRVQRLTVPVVSR